MKFNVSSLYVSAVSSVPDQILSKSERDAAVKFFECNFTIVFHRVCENIQRRNSNKILLTSIVEQTTTQKTVNKTKMICMNK